MKIVKKIFQLNLSPKESLRVKRVAALIMIPIFVLQMSSLNLFFVNVAIAEDGSGITSDSGSSGDSSSEEEEKTPPEEPETKTEEPKTEPVQDPKPESTPPANSVPAPVVENPATEPADSLTDENATDTDADNTDNQGVIDPEAAATESSETEKTAETSEKECLSEGAEIKSSSADDWNVDGDTAETNDDVKLGVKYEFPLENKVSVTFTCLPTDEEELSRLKIEQIKTSEIDLPDGVSAVTEYAYDITTGMDNGDFEYDLTLPKSDVENADVNYIEKSAEEVTEENVTKSDLKSIDEDKVKEEDDEMKVSELDHFTIYIVTSLSTTAGGVNSVMATVNDQSRVMSDPGATISAKVIATTSGSNANDDWKSTRWRIDNGSWTCIDTADHDGDGTYTETFDITAPVLPGAYDISFEAFNGANCSGGSGSATLTDGIIVSSIEITAATLDTLPQITVNQGATISAAVTVATWGTNNGDDWESTQWRIGNGNWSCANTVNHDGDGTYTETFNITAPTIPGTYDVSFRAFNDGSSCAYGSGSSSSEIFTLANGVTVNGPDLSVIKTNNVGGTVTINNPFIWTLTVTNNGSASVTFDNQDILEDDFPTGLSYTDTSDLAVAVSGGITGSIDCDISGDTLDCDDSNGGSAVVIPVGGSFSVNVEITPTAVATLANPRSGSGNICRVDPDALKTESNESNNDCSDSVNVVPITGAANPSLSQACGLDIALVIDNSTSIDSGELTQIKNAMTSFTNALNGTPTQFSVTRFATTASVIQGFTSNIANVNNAINGISVGGGYTNWQDGFTKAQGTFDPRSNPNLIIFASDGNPNRTGSSGTTVTEAQAVADAVLVANGIKNGGTRILAIGVGGDLNVANMIAISGTNVDTGDVLTSDVITSDFSELADDLAEFASQTCGGTITAKKIVDGSPASGWTMTINGQDYVTDANGFTQAVDVNPGTYSVTETLKSGYGFVSASCSGATNNGQQGTNSVIGIEVENSDIVSCTFNNTRKTAPLHINKFEDKNADGDMDPGEGPLQGWNMEVYNNNTCSGNPIASGQTGIDGIATINSLSVGEIYWIKEIVTSGWQNTTGNCRSYEIYDTAINNRIGFGNVQLNGSISGTKYEDSNGNGVKDQGELGLLGWEIKLMNETGNGELASTSTDINGVYSFSQVNPGNYQVCETNKASWIVTDPAAGAVVGTACKTVTVSSSQESIVNFGNFESGSISGMKYNDLNGNGIKDAGEPGIEGWTIYIDKNLNGDLDAGDFSTTTDSSGNYSFNNLSVGTYHGNSYSVKEVQQSGWTQTYPSNNTHYVTIVSGTTAVNIDFGNKKNSECGNGIVEDSEQCDYGSLNGQSSCSSSCEWVSTCREEMVANGGFEIPQVVSGSKWDIFGNGGVPGWTAEWYGGGLSYGGATRPDPQIELQRGVNGWNPAEGNQFVELDTDWEGPENPLNGEPSSISLFQEIPTLDGYEYKLTWKYSARPNHGNNRLGVKVGGSSIFDSGNITGSGNTNWQTESHTFLATTSLTEIRFTELGAPDSLGMFLDEVKIECLGQYIPPKCGDGIINQREEQCDGMDGVTAGQNFCTSTCQLIPTYDGEHSCSEGKTPVKIGDTHSIGSKDSDGINVNLTSGKEYLFKVLGTYNYDKNNSGKFADAAYGTSDNWNSTRDDIGIWGTNRGVTSVLGNLGNGVGVIEWDDDSNFNTSHEYQKSFTPTSDMTAQFLISDWYSNWYNANISCNEQGCMHDNEESLDLEVYECQEPPVKLKAQKVVCDSEIYLPNWGNHGSAINENTASNYVSAINAQVGKEVCRLEDQWAFQWSSSGAGSSGSFQTNTDWLDIPWKTFTAMDTVEINDIANLGGRIEVREIIPTNSGNFIGFSNAGNISAEFYCTGDVYNYDNWEWINNPQRGQTYYCVAFNSKEVGRIVGTKYNDLNGSGQRDNVGDTENTEPGLNGWTIQLKNSAGEIINSTTTDSKGDYWFDYIEGGNYKVCEIPQAGWTNTDPSDGSYCKDITVVGAQDTQVDFGNAQLIKIMASKIICDNESDLPNWGLGGPDITSTTATDWVANHSSCRLETDWQFQWSIDGIANPGDDIELASSDWNTFDTTGVEVTNPATSRLWFREALKPDYIPFSYNDATGNSDNVTAEFYCNNDVLNYDNWEWIDTAPGQNYYCVAWNVPLSDVHGFKWNDLDGDGTMNGDETKLSGWEIFIDENDNSTWDEGELKTTTSGDTDPQHFGWYWFENLTPGQYKICEVQQDGWNQTYPADSMCHTVNLPRDCSQQQGLETVSALNYVETYCQFDFGNQFVSPQLKIDKFVGSVDNYSLTDQSPGDTVHYILKIKAAGGDNGEIPNISNVNNVMVVDLPPKGFEYISGSWTASSSLGSGHVGNLNLDHAYASPGTWDLGTMQPGEIITLEYDTVISNDQDAGTYPDLAWAVGKNNLEGTVQATKRDPELFAGTQVAVVAPETPQNVELDEDTETETKTKRRVLGVTTYLPATGSGTWWLVLSVLIMAFGFGLIFAGKKRQANQDNSKNMMTKIIIFLIVGLSFLGFSGNAIAGAPDPKISVRIENPKSPIETNNFKVGFVTMDIDGQKLSAKCFMVSSPDDFQFLPANVDYVELDGGNSGNCLVDSSIAPTDGTYKFYVQAWDGSSRFNQSETVEVEINTGAPGTPLNYDRDGDSCNLSFTTANDGLTAKVELYRSEDNEFTANASTFVTSVNIGPNLAGSMNDPLGNCDDYLYAIRAVSAAGIGSGFVGDEEVNVETETRTRTVRNENIVITGGGAIPAGGAVAGEVTGETEETTQGGQEVAGAEEEGGKVAGAFSGNNWKYWIIGAIALLLLIYYAYRRSKRNSSGMAE